VKKLTEYYYSPNAGVVLYVCGNAKIEKLIRKVDAEFGHQFDSKILTCLQEKVLNSEGAMQFINRDNSILLLE